MYMFAFCIYNSKMYVILKLFAIEDYRYFDLNWGNFLIKGELIATKIENDVINIVPLN